MSEVSVHSSEHQRIILVALEESLLREKLGWKRERIIRLIHRFRRALKKADVRKCTVSEHKAAKRA